MVGQPTVSIPNLDFITADLTITAQTTYGLTEAAVRVAVLLKTVSSADSAVVDIGGDIAGKVILDTRNLWHRR